ncbi:LysR family transcriptional regulator [Acuticoccus mangrovi]|uniref:LysR family transcriptional regulator n=1 Tax=Acuticoccus mangrovi TaxID=2796142 RepID=A0A934IG83_9HYPH|nr:LysR family transcriptional regulator [Acuticoccus mangrovi]
MDFRKLSYFQAVVEAGSLHRAAEAMRVAQPALSKSIQSLEAALGVQLLVRHSRGVAPTEAGRSLYRHTGEILAAWRAAVAEVNETAEEPGGTIAVGAPPSLAQYLFGGLANEIARLYPRLRLELCEGIGHQLWSELLSERLDIAVIGNMEGSDSIITELVTHEDVMLIAPAEAALPEVVESVEALVGLPLVVTTRAPTGGSWFEDATRHSHLTFDVRYRVEGPHVATDLVTRGLGYAVTPKSGALPARVDPRLRVCRLAPLKLPRVLASRRERYLHPSVAVTRDTLRRELRRLEALNDV